MRTYSLVLTDALAKSLEELFILCKDEEEYKTIEDMMAEMLGEGVEAWYDFYNQGATK